MSAPSVLVLNPPANQPVFRDHYCSSEAKSTYLWQPLDLQIQALWLRSHGFAVTAIDAIAQNLSFRLNLMKLYFYQILISLISMPVLCSMYGAFGILVSLAISYLSGFLVNLEKK